MKYLISRDEWTVDHQGTPCFASTSKYVSENEWEFNYSKRCKDDKGIYFFGSPDIYEDRFFDECWPDKVTVSRSEIVYRYDAKELTEAEATEVEKIINDYKNLGKS